MCTTMDDDSVLIIFPEGENWTPRRWDAAIDRLEQRGQHNRAERAAAMTNVLAPRTAGAIAALSARHDVSVVFVAHVGLEDLISLGEIWRKVPLRRRVTGTYWSVAPDQIPDDPAEISNWMFDQWEAVDRWIADHRAEALGKRYETA
jgi:1-acyl-sn-glycerol-3-phosphate acyltransferase